MNLENLNLVELNNEEVIETEGGINPYLAWIGLGLAWDIVSSPVASAAAFGRGFNQWN